MSRPPLARERVLDAFEALLIEEGAPGATLDATARRADVSKGGLLYHFASKEELAQGLLERLATLADEDLEEMAAHPQGEIDYFIRTSIMEGDPFDRVLLAVARLGQSGHEPSTEALRTLRERWADSLRPVVRDETALAIVLLVSDGLYYNNGLDVLGEGAVTLATPLPQDANFDELIARVRSATEKID